MRFSAFSWYGYFEDFICRIKRIKNAGFDEVMISWEDEMEPFAHKKEDLPDLVRKEGLEITNMHAPFIGYNIIWEGDAKDSQPLLDTFIAHVEDCRRFDIPAIVVHTNDMDLGPHKMENGLTFFSKLAEAGEKYGVNIAVENVSRQYLLRYVLDRIKTPHFGMCYDSSHDYMLPCGRGRLLKAYKDRIKALHLSDNDLHEDKHWIPGEGQVPFDELLPEILSINPKVLSFEVCANQQWRQGDPDAFLLKLRHSLDRFLDKE